MKNTSNNDLLFLAPIVTILTLAIAIAAALFFNNNGTQFVSNTSGIKSNTQYSHSTASNNQPGMYIGNTYSKGNLNNQLSASHYQNFSMTEPFSEIEPFEFTPAAWMQMMNVFMNNMQITQMMHQMFAMPAQMMSPAMWSNPHAGLSIGTANSSKPMSPEQYKKWYQQQLDANNTHKK
jgi:hypothetical protein